MSDPWEWNERPNSRYKPKHPFDLSGLEGQLRLYFRGNPPSHGETPKFDKPENIAKRIAKDIETYPKKGDHDIGVISVRYPESLLRGWSGNSLRLDVGLYCFSCDESLGETWAQYSSFDHKATTGAWSPSRDHKRRKDKEQLAATAPKEPIFIGTSSTPRREVQWWLFPPHVRSPNNKWGYSNNQDQFALVVVRRNQHGELVEEHTLRYFYTGDLDTALTYAKTNYYNDAKGTLKPAAQWDEIPTAPLSFDQALTDLVTMIRGKRGLEGVKMIEEFQEKMAILDDVKKEFLAEIFDD